MHIDNIYLFPYIIKLFIFFAPYHEVPWISNIGEGKL
jgi:hypothetical protein